VSSLESVERLELFRGVVIHKLHESTVIRVIDSTVHTSSQVLDRLGPTGVEVLGDGLCRYYVPAGHLIVS